MEISKLELAADKLKTSLKIKGDYALTLISMGNLCFEAGDSKKASKQQQNALKQDASNLQALIGLANS